VEPCAVGFYRCEVLGKARGHDPRDASFQPLDWVWMAQS
jgi:hypothetical protein